jgi:hypothetical protein
VVVEGVAAKGKEHQVPPAGVRGRLRFEDDRNEQANVLDPPPGSAAVPRAGRPGRARGRQGVTRGVSVRQRRWRRRPGPRER